MVPKLGERIEVTIEKLSSGGDGIARLPGSDSLDLASSRIAFVVFVPYSVPGDQLEIEVTEKFKTYARGMIRQILAPGLGRIQSPCPYFFSPNKNQWCGGCNLQQLAYSAQLSSKVQSLKETLQKVGGLNTDKLDFGVTSADGEQGEWRYRNKIQIPFTSEGERVAAGFFAPQSHRIVPIDDCLIHSEKMMHLVRFVREKMEKWKLNGYLEQQHRGWLRHLVVREEQKEGKLLATFVTLSEAFPHRAEWIDQIQTRFPNVAGICQNVNPNRTNVILDRNWKTLWGQDYLVESLQGLGPGGKALRLKVSAGSFFQVNTRMAEKLYEVVKEFLSFQKNPGLRTEKNGSPITAFGDDMPTTPFENPNKRGQFRGGRGNTLLDLYCGVGGIALACAENFSQVLGVEETSSSIADAQENARINKTRNCRFVCGDVEHFLKGGQRSWELAPDNTSVVIDPPRKGCSEGVIRSLIKLRPRQIVYVSCEPSTLARDLRALCSNGYALKRVQAVDLFPQSSHIESVSNLERKG